ncbi:hypothetical protein BKA65DRAFT_474066 [Rhexocercosporidium sp. MPI-PUGE-AT-0058]|nr:hypothetical protein BKA65DRAFT_474066 [Rhexocercosporidium sp. MPI-PUGE-AT-0058]
MARDQLWKGLFIAKDLVIFSDLSVCLAAFASARYHALVASSGLYCDCTPNLESEPIMKRLISRKKQSRNTPGLLIRANSDTAAFLPIPRKSEVMNTNHPHLRKISAVRRSYSLNQTVETSRDSTVACLNSSSHAACDFKDTRSLKPPNQKTIKRAREVLNDSSKEVLLHLGEHIFLDFCSMNHPKELPARPRPSLAPFPEPRGQMQR